ncbi:cysteine synthase A [Prolixibacter denitrificans]|uniref:Cysteine synthase n=1 Tax=Prolixibacter denitrificans TaxID=1541063 RepID=A0A2P8CJY6_9BACT|nr:cysteine synthase A [Prolixibacter denitrificans]PSK85288.1 cysteine synthase A [Prolixibacter denitrificans]GET19910.1 cysteine synthase [Prolixibacter denitrificans]
MKVKTILETIGNTPHVRINHLYPDDYEVYAKVEKTNPGGSIKDRIALQMINDAEERGALNPDSIIIEPTSGNTGIGLALVAAVKKYKLILVMPESMSIERRRILKAYGAQLELTPKEQGMKGAINRAKELAEQNPGSFIPSQFDNPANIQAHAEFTAKEILADFPEGIDYLITGVGTGGHISGVSMELKKRFPDMKTFAVEPETSPVIGGGAPGPHPIQGIGAGFIPENLKTETLDGTIQVSKDEAFEFAQKAAAEEGLLVGISSGASLAAVNKKIKELPKGSRILTFSYDTGERYLSVDGLF